MDKWQIIDTFWNIFGVPAYDESSVPDDAGFPRITYQVATGSLSDTLPMTASLWYANSRWVEVSQLADRIGEHIGLGGVMLPCDEGAVWIQRGIPFAQRMSDPTDDTIRRIVLQITAEFITS